MIHFLNSAFILAEVLFFVFHLFSVDAGGTYVYVANVAKIYGRLPLTCSVLRVSTFSVFRFD